jgi:hypothetical protein
MNKICGAVSVIFCVAVTACTHESQAPERSKGEQSTPPVATLAERPAQVEPSVETMQPAIQSGKLSAPVDLLFRFSDDIVADRPVRVDFAISPQVPGDNLRFELVANDAAQVETAESMVAVQKAQEKGVYRKSVSLTPRAGLTKLQAIVSISVGTDTYSGVYSIPVAMAAAQINADQSNKESVESLNRRTD